MLGAITGDIIGSIYEHHNVKSKDFQLLSEKSHMTDDSTMTLAIARALSDLPVEKYAPTEEFDRKLYKLCKKYMIKYTRKFPNRGFSTRSLRWAMLGGIHETISCGNGSAMRVSPVAWYVWWYAKTVNKTMTSHEKINMARKLARITAIPNHAHHEGIKGAEAVASVIMMGLIGWSKDEIKRYIEDNFSYNLNLDLEKLQKKYKFDVTCQGSVPQAIFAFLQGKDFEDVIRTAVSIGGDSDTIAAMAGSMAEPFYQIPYELLQNSVNTVMGITTMAGAHYHAKEMKYIGKICLMHHAWELNK